jgi:hypothetical protein
MIGPNLSSRDPGPDVADEDADEDAVDPAPGFGVAAGRTGPVLSGARIGSEREAADGPPDGVADDASDGDVVAFEADVGAVGDAVLGDWAGPVDAGVGASSSIGTPIWRAFSAADRTCAGSSTEAMTTTGAELNSVELTPAATASGVWPATTVVQSLGSRTPAALPPEPPELPPGAALAPTDPHAASVSVAAVSNPTERSCARRRARVAATEPPSDLVQPRYCRTSALGGQPDLCNGLSRSVRERARQANR